MKGARMKTRTELLQALAACSDQLDRAPTWGGFGDLQHIQHDILEAYQGHAITANEYRGFNRLYAEIEFQYREKLRP